MPQQNQRAVVFGEVLFDSFPDGANVLGGAPFNVAWHLQGFGLSPLFISRIGQDARGDLVRQAMAAWGMDTSGLQVDPNHPTGTVQVSLNGGQPSFDILADQAYDFIDPEAAVKAVAPAQPALLYLGSLIARNQRSRRALEGLLARPDTPAFIDVNLRPPWWTTERVNHLLTASQWAKLNDDELLQLSGRSLHLEDLPGLTEAAQAFRARHGLERLVITRGKLGALFVTQDEQVAAPAAEVERLVDTVGAGDAFSAVTLLGFIKGWALATVLERALEFAAAVCGIRGATTDDARLYAQYRDQWGV